MIFAQNNTSSEFVLGNQELVLPTDTGFRVALKGNGWIFDVLHSSFLNPDALSLVAIEENSINTSFLFYKLSSTTTDIIHFRRVDSDVIYSYVLTLQWSNKLSSSADSEDGESIYQDKYIDIKALPLGDMMVQEAENIVESSGDSTIGDSSTEKMAETTSDANDGTIEDEVLTFQNDSVESSTTSSSNVIGGNTIKETNDAEDFVVSAVDSNTPITQNQSVIELLDTNNSTNNFIEDIDIETVVDEENSDNTDAQNTGESMMLIAEDKVGSIEAMSLEDMQTYLTQIHDTHTQEEILADIMLWMNAHPDIFEQATLLWNYGRFIENNIDDPNEILLAIQLYETITQDYPLSYEYFEALERMQILKTQYRFILH